MSEPGTASSVGCHGLTTKTNACHYVERRKYTAMLHTGIGIGIGYWYRQWPILLDILDIGWLSWYRSNPTIVHTLCHDISCI